MRDLRHLVSNLVTSGLPPQSDGETLHRVGMVNTFSALAFAYLALFGSLHWAEGNRVQAVGYVAIGAANAANLVFLRMRQRVSASAWIACSIAAALCFYRLHDVPGSYGYLWSFAFPVFGVFSLGLKRGMALTAAFSLTCALVLYLPGNPFMPPGYDGPFKIRFLATVVGLAMMSGYIEHARMRAERALQASERRFRSLIENSASVYAIVGADGTVLYESPSLERVYGYRPEELVGQNILNLVHPDDREGAQAELARLMEQPGQARTTETRYRHRDGSWRDIEVSGVCLLHDPAVRGVVLTSHDITDRKRAERETRALTENLEERVRERTDALQRSEEQRRQSEKMEAIGQLAGGIAHDFNNQLAAIMSCLDILKMALGKDVKLSGYLEAASIAARRSADLTSQLLAFARKSARRTIPIDAHRIVAEVVSLLKHSIDKRIVIKQRLGRGAHVLMGDPAQLESALLNVAINARDAMPDGGEITFTTSALELDAAACRQQSLDISPGRYLRLSVSDTGRGIDEEARKHIFEPFFTTKRAGEGTGMGLAAAYGTARMHRGTLVADTEPQPGATFHFFLPMAEGRAALADEETPLPRSADRPARVLLVDDEKVVRRAVGMALRELGHTVTLCEDGAVAVDEYARCWRDIDVVVLDMVMPNLTGKQTFLELRRINPAAKVILASGYSIDQEAQESLDAGAVAFVEKPFKVAALSRRISEVAAR